MQKILRSNVGQIAQVFKFCSQAYYCKLNGLIDFASQVRKNLERLSSLLQKEEESDSDAAGGAGADL